MGGRAGGGDGRLEGGGEEIAGGNGPEDGRGRDGSMLAEVQHYVGRIRCVCESYCDARREGRG